MQDAGCSDKKNAFWKHAASIRELGEVLFHKGRRATICNGAPSRTIYDECPQVNEMIRDHFFGNPLEPFLNNLTTSSSQVNLYLKKEDSLTSNNETKSLVDLLSSSFSSMSLDDTLRSESSLLQTEALPDPCESGDEISKGDTNAGVSLIERVKSFADKLNKFDMFGDESSDAQYRHRFDDTIEDIEALLNLQDGKVSLMAPKDTERRDEQGRLKRMQYMTDFRKPAAKRPVQFRNIVSPVAMYIKNPSTVPTVQHVFASKSSIKKELFANSQRSKNDKENRMEEKIQIINDLPRRIYRPAACTVTTQEDNLQLKLPRNIQKKMINVTPRIIKHSQRSTKRDISEKQLEAALMRENLTCDFSSPSSRDSVMETSLQTSKETYIQ